MIIIWIKHFHNISRKVGLLHSLLIIALVKRIQTKTIHWLCIPDSKRIDNTISISYNWKVIWNRLDGLIIFLIPNQSSILFSTCYIAAKFNHFCVFWTTQLKRVAIPKPIIWNFTLKTITNLLLKHTITITNTTTICRVSQRRKRVKKTCGKTSQSAVSKRCIRLLVLNHIDVKSKLLKCFREFFVRHQINHIVSKCTSH